MLEFRDVGLTPQAIRPETSNPEKQQQLSEGIDDGSRAD
jgi:hypothetical protein